MIFLLGLMLLIVGSNNVVGAEDPFTVYDAKHAELKKLFLNGDPQKARLYMAKKFEALETRQGNGIWRLNVTPNQYNKISSNFDPQLAKLAADENKAVAFFGQHLDRLTKAESERLDRRGKILKSLRACRTIFRAAIEEQQ